MLIVFDLSRKLNGASQRQMEQFSRECLEIDTEALEDVEPEDTTTPSDSSGDMSSDSFSSDASKTDKSPDSSNGGSTPPLLRSSSASMDRVYSRAANLVQRTLDVEGVLVMDVSHVEVLESMNAEGSVSVLLHRGDDGNSSSSGPTTRSLSVDEYQNLNAFFAKYPDGKISEGIVPMCFRPFLPVHIQYALSESFPGGLLHNGIVFIFSGSGTDFQY